jgi:signal peptidase I
LPSSIWSEVNGLIVSPREGLEGIYARHSLGGALLLGVVAYYWRTLPISEVLLRPIGGPAVYLALNALLALGWVALVTGLIHLATRLTGDRRGQWRDLILLWSYAQIPGIALMLLGGVFVTTASRSWLHALGMAWLAPAILLAGSLFIWKLVLQYQAIKVCYGISGVRLLSVIGLALVLYNLVVWAEFTLVDERARVPPVARRAMSSALCPVVPSRIYVPLPFDRLVYRVRAPRRGEVVGFLPSGSTEFPVTILLRDRWRFLGRVVGLPGDEVEVRQGRVYLNGKAVEEPHGGPGGVDVGPTRVLDDHYFVLGDNRALPLDQYHGGLVARSDLRGRLTEVGWLRWNYLAEANRC